MFFMVDAFNFFAIRSREFANAATVVRISFQEIWYVYVFLPVICDDILKNTFEIVL